MRDARIITINGGDTTIAVVKPGPHRAKRVVRALESEDVDAVMISRSSPGGPLASMPDPPVIT